MKQIEDLRYKRTLFVGLGGAGAKTLRILKGKIKETNNGELPKQIKFLLIDTNATELANYRDFDSSEKICIAVREPYLRYEYDRKSNSSTHEFIPLKNVHSLLALERGAGQIRSNGHFAVIESQYSNKLMRVFREKADDIENIDIDCSKLEKDPKIEVRLVFSIAGGTGSGTFLPIAMLLRAAIKHCELTAYIYSATHFEKFVENSAKYSVMQNAYAALCELDYMMHFGMQGYDKIQFNFGPQENQHILATHRPFEEVYYIDKRTNLPTSDSVEFAYNEIKRLQDNTSDIMHLAATNIITAHQGTVDNVRQKIQEGQFNVGDKYAWLSGVGMSNLFYNKSAKDSLVVIDAALRAIEARISNGDYSDIAQEIANEFNKTDFRFDESKGDEDGDPILNHFVDKTEIDIFSKEQVYSNKKKQYELTTTSGGWGVSLDDVEKSSVKSDEKIKNLCDVFKNKVFFLIKSLIDEEKYKEIEVHGVPNGGISFKLIKEVLNNIDKILKDSSTALEKEYEHWNTLRKELDNKLLSEIDKSDEDVEQKNNGGISSFLGKLFGRKPVNSTNKTDGTIDLKDRNQPIQEDALRYLLYAERASKGLKVFIECKKELAKRVEYIDQLERILTDACNYGNRQYKKDIEGKSKDELNKKELRLKASTNVVEINSFNPDEGYKLSYDNLYELYKSEDNKQVPNEQAKFSVICSYVSGNSNEFDDYLQKSINQIAELAKDNRIMVERTECQKKIDRLIDLSMPTMQIDYHGYGDRVKVDNFWYIMTDCPEENQGTKSESKKSVGALLKILLEQNILDAKVNLVHVPGWKNQAVLYRVDSAVPAYFVDGVCISTGGHTLEGCYEELKKTKRTYTPFSHKQLQEKLENGICVLKPHDDVAENEALEHWINFNLLGLIQFESVKGTTGVYKIKSEKLGEVQTKSLTDLDKVLLLGDTREHAFNTFSRYCKTLVEENLLVLNPAGFTYAEAINPLEYADESEYINRFVMDGDKYLDTIFTEHEVPILMWHGERISWQEYNKHLDENNPEHKQLKKEVVFMDARYTNHSGNN